MRIAILCSASASFLLGLPFGGLAQSKQKPNVLIIMTDQQRWDAMRCAGNLEISTPNMDRIAREGVMFNNAYSACPVSVPARTAILTGRTIFNNKVLGNSDSESDSVPPFQTFDMVLAANGYRTEYYGKWHAPYQFASKYKNTVKTTNKDKHAPYVQSNVDAFREYLDKLGVSKTKTNDYQLIDRMSLRPYNPVPVDLHYGEAEDDSNSKKKNKDSQGENFGTFEGDEMASLAAFEGNEALEALHKMNTDQPFSLTCSFGPPHPPFVVPEKYAEMYKLESIKPSKSITDMLVNAPYTRNTLPTDARFANEEMNKHMKLIYYAMVSQVDEWVGKLLDELDKKGMAKNTIVLFVSDHGELLGDHGLVSKNKMYEGSARIPLMIRYPAVIPAGKIVETPVSHHDIFATILDYTGMKAPENDGRSLRKLINGKKDKVDYAVSTWGAVKNGGPFMLRQGDWKLIVYLQMGDKKQKTVSALYNLKTDPLELTNLIGNNPDKANYAKKAAQLKLTLRNWMIQTKTPYINELDKTNF